jgi:hypothetical protein
LQELERHFEQAHKAYLESTEHRTQAFKQLTKNDASAARVIEKRMKKLIKLQVCVMKSWQTGPRGSHAAYGHVCLYAWGSLQGI